MGGSEPSERLLGQEQSRIMQRSKKHREKERERYYLLPGMGGRATRRKRVLMLKAGLAVGLVMALILSLILYFLYHRPIR